MSKPKDSVGDETKPDDSGQVSPNGNAKFSSPEQVEVNIPKANTSRPMPAPPGQARPRTGPPNQVEIQQMLHEGKKTHLTSPRSIG